MGKILDIEERWPTYPILWYFRYDVALSSSPRALICCCYRRSSKLPN